MFNNIVHDTKYKLKKPLDVRDITTMFNRHILVSLNITIFIYDKDHNNYKNSIVGFNYINFRCRKRYNKFESNKTNIFITNDNNCVCYTSKSPETRIVVYEPKQATILPDDIIRIQQDNTYVKSPRNNIYNITLHNEIIPLKKVICGKKYKPTYDEDIVQVCDKLNSHLNDVMYKWFINPETPDATLKKSSDTYTPYNRFNEYLNNGSCQKYTTETYKYTPYRKPSIDKDIFYYYTNADFKKQDRLRNRPTNITDEQLNNCKNNVIDQLLKHTAEMYKPVVCNSQYYQDNSKKCIDLNEIEIVTFKI